MTGLLVAKVDSWCWRQFLGLVCGCMASKQASHACCQLDDCRAGPVWRHVVMHCLPGPKPGASCITHVLPICSSVHQLCIPFEHKSIGTATSAASTTLNATMTTRQKDNMSLCEQYTPNMVAIKTPLRVLGPLQTLALDPRYTSRKTKELVTGSADGRVQLSSQVRAYGSRALHHKLLCACCKPTWTLGRPWLTPVYRWR